jgi:hypothetical protein
MMNIKRTWIVAGATIAVAGFAGAGIALASDDVHLNDPEQVPVVQLQSDDTAKQAGDGATAASAGSADSPDDSGYVAPAPVADSGNSPAPAPARPVYSADSAGSGASGGSADSTG